MFYELWFVGNGDNRLDCKKMHDGRFKKHYFIPYVKDMIYEHNISKTRQADYCVVEFSVFDSEDVSDMYLLTTWMKKEHIKIKYYFNFDDVEILNIPSHSNIDDGYYIKGCIRDINVSIFNNILRG